MSKPRHDPTGDQATARAERARKHKLRAKERLATCYGVQTIRVEASDDMAVVRVMHAKGTRTIEVSKPCTIYVVSDS